MRLLVAFSLILFSGCKTLEIAVKHPMSGVHFVAKIDAREEGFRNADHRPQEARLQAADRKLPDNGLQASGGDTDGAATGEECPEEVNAATGT